MNNTKKLKLNGITSLANQVVIIISGLILPKFILQFYGSDINGLLVSVTQFLYVISFLELGVGAVVQSALYKPLAQNNTYDISLIIKAAQKFFKRIAYILLAYILFLIIFFPHIINQNVDYVSTVFLIIAMSISQFSQYYFGIVNQLLLNADQRNYISEFIVMITIILNTLGSIILIMNDFGIVEVKFFTAIIYLLRPLFMKYYVNQHYNIDRNVPGDYQIPQKWNGLAQHLATVVASSSDVFILSIFSSLKEVSVYSVYNMVTMGVRQLVRAFSSGIQSFFGKLLAQGKHEEINSSFLTVEWLLHNLITLVFGLTLVLINSFIAIYTKGIVDTNYNAPLFSFLITISHTVYCYRIPYNSIVLAAGHYKQTQTSSLIEVFINIAISVILVQEYGLVGVALGTFCSMVYRTIYLSNYISKYILLRSNKIFYKLIFMDILNIFFIIFLSRVFLYTPSNFVYWMVWAAVLGAIYALFMILINYIIYPTMLKKYILKIFNSNL